MLVVSAAVLFVLGAAAAAGLALGTPWGRAAVIGAGVLNLAGGVIALADGMEGAVIGTVVSALGIVLGFLTDRSTSRVTTPSLG